MNTKNSIKDLGVRAKKAAGLLANISNDQKNKALNNLKKNLEDYQDAISHTLKKITNENESSKQIELLLLVKGYYKEKFGELIKIEQGPVELMFGITQLFKV